MVKTKALFLGALAILLCSCSPAGTLAGEQPQVLEIARGRLGRSVSLVRTTDTLVALYSDRETTSLDAVEIPVSDALPRAAPAARLVDRIDTTPPLAPSFGEHAAMARGDAVTVMYLARRAEDKLVLKLATHAAGSQDWSVDVIEPPGNPVAILPAEDGRLDLVWAAGSLLSMSYPGSPPPVTLVSPFIPENRASVVAPPAGGDRGFTVYDAVTHALLFFSRNRGSYGPSVVEGAGPVHSSLVLDDGSLAVFSWDAQSKRLALFENGPGTQKPTRKTVSVSDATTTVALLPQSGAPRAPLIFLYDEATRSGAGRVVHQLSLLTPGPALGGGYRKIVLASGEQPIADFSALEAGDGLYVLLLQGSLKLLKLKLP